MNLESTTILNEFQKSKKSFKIAHKKPEFLVKNNRIRKSFYTNTLGAMTKKGKKNAAKAALFHSSFVASKMYEIPNYKILTKILSGIKCYAEIKNVVRRKKGKKISQTRIPFPLTPARQRLLKIKWFLEGAKKSKIKTQFAYKLIEKFRESIEKPEVLKKQRTALNEKIIENIANAHFRWVPKK